MYVAATKNFMLAQVRRAGFEVIAWFWHYIWNCHILILALQQISHDIHVEWIFMRSILAEHIRSHPSEWKLIEWIGKGDICFFIILIFVRGLAMELSLWMLNHFDIS